jgi:hypothetical protein|tara:strand:- start:6886 stop:7731 length:846 start_codon:yes stop_codon:yes gene_type:complete
MKQKMEKFINFKQLNVVVSGTSTADGSSALTLTDSGATFTQFVLPNAIVWDRVTDVGSDAGGQKYLVTAVTSDTELALVAIGVTSAQGGGVPDTTGYFIYMPEYTKLQYGTASATETNFLVDGSGVNFITANVQIGDYVVDITGGSSATVTSVEAGKLGVSDDIFVSADNYLVSKISPDNHNKIMRSASIADVSLGSNSSAVIDITYGSAGTDAGKIDYAYSSTIGSLIAFRQGVNDAIVDSLGTSWPDVAYEFPGILNPSVSVTNATWLGGQEFFILRVS